ncbi:N-acetylmuramoyl-L-alanine amidase [Megasphaera vaginalis (ex Bordigoni et al. 2020)]|uniref:N-acetylmuramoyl-L-alanine amidase n=1 Tax=Megasphaera vaginalis (ex Bordigoni et al. 2020) TaxID=2045301 RepID=UPI000C7E7E7C|nr:N-acetylmuramoyl-L-alanine amidase [Megasphaera vaginalis (ex Bordigoni et al. 2020)]
MLICINPGHDRKRDSGAVNERLRLRECDAAYELGLAVTAALAHRQVRVALRQDNDLAALCKEANAMGADLFVSLHFNAFDGTASGTETFCSGSAGSTAAAVAVQRRLCRVLQLPDRGVKRRPDLYVLSRTIMPAILVEVCFLDNDGDMARYAACRADVAAAVAAAVTVPCLPGV